MSTFRIFVISGPLLSPVHRDICTMHMKRPANGNYMIFDLLYTVDGHPVLPHVKCEMNYTIY